MSIAAILTNGSDDIDIDIDIDRSARAACNTPDGTMTDLFFSEDPVSIARAKHICRECPLRDGCLAGAVERREPNGVWGGQLISNGRIIAYKRRRGRPPREREAEHVVVSGTRVLVAPAIRSA